MQYLENFRFPHHQWQLQNPHIAWLDCLRLALRFPCQIKLDNEVMKHG